MEPNAWQPRPAHASTLPAEFCPAPSAPTTSAAGPAAAEEHSGTNSRTEAPPWTLPPPPECPTTAGGDRTGAEESGPVHHAIRSGPASGRPTGGMQLAATRPAAPQAQPLLVAIAQP
eukprot:3134856-Lingulodinium_polyedra.AAC.2